MSAVRARLVFAVLLAVAACARTTTTAGTGIESAAGAAAAPGSGAGADTTAAFQVVVPPQVAAFTLEGRRGVEGAPEDVQLRYAGPAGLAADVFIYAGPDFAARCALDCARKVIDQEVGHFRDSFRDMIQREYVQKIKVRNELRLTPPAGAAWRLGRHLVLDVQRDGAGQRSDFYLFYFPGVRIKVRATYAEEPDRAEAISAFVTSLLPQLVGKPSGG